jgi:hypothetical protein
MDHYSNSYWSNFANRYGLKGTVNVADLASNAIERAQLIPRVETARMKCLKHD